MNNLLQNSNEISIQGVVAIIALVSAVTSAFVSGLMQIIMKWVESYFSKKQTEITNEHEKFMIEEKNLQEIRMKRLDKYYDERKEIFSQFVSNATAFLNDPEGRGAITYYKTMLKYRNLALLYGNEKYRKMDKEFMQHGCSIEEFMLFQEFAKEKLNEMIEVINEILRND